jgi:hypothetical protein
MRTALYYDEREIILYAYFYMAAIKLLKQFKFDISKLERYYFEPFPYDYLYDILALLPELSFGEEDDEDDPTIWNIILEIDESLHEKVKIITAVTIGSGVLDVITKDPHHVCIKVCEEFETPSLLDAAFFVVRIRKLLDKAKAKKRKRYGK